MSYNQSRILVANSFFYAIVSDMKKVNKKSTKVTVTSWLKVIVFLLDDVVALLIIVFILHLLKIQIPWPIIITAAILLGVLLFIINRAIIPDFRRKSVTGQEGMIGLQGSVIKTLSPIGTVLVEGEHWKAKSVDGKLIRTDESVQVVEVDRLTLLVRRKPK
jgi:membrane-bound ClpP family serine protease